MECKKFHLLLLFLLYPIELALSVESPQDILDNQASFCPYHCNPSTETPAAKDGILYSTGLYKYDQGSSRFVPQFQHRNSAMKHVPSLNMTIATRGQEAHQLEVQLLGLKVNANLTLKICGSKENSFIPSTNDSVIISTCDFTNDLAVIHGVGKLGTVFLPISITTPTSFFISSYVALGTHTTEDIRQRKDAHSNDSKGKRKLVPFRRFENNKKRRRARAVPEERYFIVATRTTIARVSLDGQRFQTVVSNLTNAVAIDYDYRNRLIYWTNTVTGKIMQSDFDGLTVSTLPLNGLVRPDGLAFNWITNRLYFTDQAIDIIGVYDVAAVTAAVLIRTGTGTRPRAIALDPYADTMYFTDWGTVGRIEKASLNGDNRIVIHDTSLVWPNALTLDIQTQTLYWADASLDKVESSNVDGTNRVLLAQTGVVHPFSIVLADNNLYFTDWEDDTIRYLSTAGGTVRSLHSATSFSNTTIFGIQVVDPLQGFKFVGCRSSPCSINAVCTDTSSSLTCNCNTGYTGDGFICEDNNFEDIDYFIVATRSTISRVSLDGLRYQILVGSLANAVAIDYDYRNGLIYWTDTNSGLIMRSNLNGSSVTTLPLTSTGLVRPDGLAVDWVNNRLYFTDEVVDIIGVYDLTTLNTIILIRTGTDTRPRAIVLDPYANTMYFTDWGTVGRIEKASLNGDNRTVIHNTSLVWPNALTLDIQTQTLYWADAILDKVESSNVDGTNRVLLAQTGVVHPFSIVFAKNTLYFTDWFDNTIRYLSATGGTVRSLHSVTEYSSSTIFGIQVVGQQRQNINGCDSDPCHTNAMCASTIGSYTCTCDAGYAGDGAACTNINECLTARPCDGNATCADTLGSFTCTCNSGFTGDGVTCQTLQAASSAAIVPSVSVAVVVVVILVVIVVALVIVFLVLRFRKGNYTSENEIVLTPNPIYEEMRNM